MAKLTTSVATSSSSSSLRGYLDRFPTTTAFVLLAAARVLTALANAVVSDCDEVYNYWEPTHFLAHGRGFQTWEYSPEFALRSYAFVGVYAAKARAAAALHALMFGGGGGDGQFEFYAVRCVMALECAACETVFLAGVARRFRASTACAALVLLLAAPALWISSTALLPSSFAMATVFLAVGAHLLHRDAVAVAAACVGCLLGWPFALLVFVPMAAEMLARRGFSATLARAVAAGSLVVGASVAVDTHFYRRPLLALFNIVRYNVVNDASALYGTEPPSFYLANGVLNFNVAFVLALVAAPLVAVAWSFANVDARVASRWLALCSIAPFYVWLAFMSRQAHKEERFLFVAYPFVVLAAALALGVLARIAAALCCAVLPAALGSRRAWTTRVRALVLTVFVALALARMAALHTGYSAPLVVYRHLADVELPAAMARTPPPVAAGDVLNVCVGKEWYRFPSSFFLPRPDAVGGAVVTLAFVRSAFTGLLPKAYDAHNSTWGVPSAMNDRNREEPSRYVDIDACHYLVDLDLPAQAERRYVDDDASWQLAFEHPFLDAAASDKLLRAFYVPLLASRPGKLAYNRYVLLKRRV